MTPWWPYFNDGITSFTFAEDHQVTISEKNILSSDWQFKRFLMFSKTTIRHAPSCNAHE